MDWNNDGRQDLVVGDGKGYVNLFMNRGTREEPELDSGSHIETEGDPIRVDGRAAPIVDDWNGDGKKDLLIGSFEGRIRVYINEGTDEAPLFGSRYNLKFTNGEEIKVSTRVAPRIYDWDRDGLKDILAGEYEGNIYFLKNEGTNSAPVFDRAEKLLLTTGEALLYSGKGGGHRTRLTVTDWNADGVDDLLLGGTDGKLMFFAGSPDHLLISLKERFWLTEVGEKIRRRWNRWRGSNE